MFLLTKSINVEVNDTYKTQMVMIEASMLVDDKCDINFRSTPRSRPPRGRNHGHDTRLQTFSLRLSPFAGTIYAN